MKEPADSERPAQARAWTWSAGEFDSLHRAIAEFAEGIYRAGLTPGTLKQIKPQKAAHYQQPMA